LEASSTYRITGEDETLFPYKIQMLQAFHGAYKAWRVDFYDDLKMFLEDNPAVL
jgi:hypothetical protein